MALSFSVCVSGSRVGPLKEGVELRQQVRIQVNIRAMVAATWLANIQWRRGGGGSPNLRMAGHRQRALSSRRKSDAPRGRQQGKRRLLLGGRSAWAGGGASFRQWQAAGLGGSPSRSGTGGGRGKNHSLEAGPTMTFDPWGKKERKKKLIEFRD